MHLKLYKAILVLSVVSTFACGGAQNGGDQIETRPLEENKAFEIINSTIGSRGYQVQIDTNVKLANGTEFPCDIRVAGESIAIEYITAKDAADMGEIPPPEAASRLHVILGEAAATVDPAVQPTGGAAPTAPPATESVFVYFIKEGDYKYHFNPTSRTRAVVTYHEIENRLRRDLNDFLTWYESRPR